MEWVEQVKLGRPKWLAAWPIIALALLFTIALILIDGRLLAWSGMALFGAPLTALATLALFLLPGLALLRLFWHDELPAMQRWPLAIGLSCAVLPLLLLLSEPLGLRWNSWLCWGFMLLCLLALLWPGPSKIASVSWRQLLGRYPDRQHLLLIGMTLLAIMVRLYATRDLVVGMWGDSYHHTIIAQLLVDNGGLFSSWQPYAPLRTFTYHYGFHSIVAWLSWLSGQPVTQALLIVGQLQSALAVPLAYLFTRHVLKSDRAGLWAALITGFISTMPAYYVNWGRYTQLAGQTILPGACIAWIALLEAATEPSVNLRQLLRPLALAVIVTAGLTLTHYRIAVFAACFVVSFGLYLLGSKVRSPRQFGQMVAASLVAGVLMLILVLPWLIRLREGALLQIGGNFLSTNIGGDQTNSLPPLDSLFSLYAKNYLVALGVLGIVLLLWHRQWHGTIVIVWAAAVWLMANPYLIGLPGAGIITNFAVIIANYLVIAPLAAAAITILYEWGIQILPLRTVVQSSQLAIGVLLLLWSLAWQQQIVSSQFELFTPADAAAMNWIRGHTPADARFFVNGFPAYGNTLYAGTDGGWWLPFMSGRRSNLPPITYGSEAGEQPGYQRIVNAENAKLVAHPLTDSQTAADLRAAGYTYLYNGPAASPASEYIDPNRLARSPLYEQVYSQGGVTIWRVR